MGQAESRKSPESSENLHANPMPHLGRVGRALHFAVLAVVAVVALKAFALDSFQVVSSSMAPNLVGPHVLFVCPATDAHFRLPAQATPHALRKLVCPSCGATHAASEQRLRTGDRLVVDRMTFQFREPRRFEPVVLRHLSNAGKLETVVKRIVGLPGESVQIIDGDVIVNGQRLQKSLAEFKRLAVPVVDFEHLAKAQQVGSLNDEVNPTELGIRHWPHAAAWDVRRSAFVIDGGVLEFGVKAEMDDALSSRDALNQLFTIRADQVPPMTDLLLTIDKLRATPKRTADDSEPHLTIFLSNNIDSIKLVLHPRSRKWVALDGDQELATGTLSTSTDLAEGVSLDLAIVDGTFQAALRGEPLFRVDKNGTRIRNAKPENVIQITASGCRAQLGGMRIARDLSYSTPEGLGARAGLDEPHKLGDAEYFVLGDNSAISDDSRFWREPGVARRQILGRAVLVHWPAERDEFLGGWIQVPRPDKIRYIR